MNWVNLCAAMTDFDPKVTPKVGVEVTPKVPRKVMVEVWQKTQQILRARMRLTRARSRIQKHIRERNLSLIALPPRQVR